MARSMDVIFSIVGLCLLWPILVIIYVIGLFDTGSPIFIQERVGRNRGPFNLIKFRTMAVNTESVATHLAGKQSVTKLGKILRKTKLDELPQLLNVLKGDMSLVGPRPCLYNQKEVIDAREKYNVFLVRPGITGLAQIREVDMSKPKELARLDAEMIKGLTARSYLMYIVKTVFGAGAGDRV